MKHKTEIEAMREQAYREQFMAKDRASPEGKAYAEGVEAGLLWAISYAGEPFGHGSPQPGADRPLITTAAPGTRWDVYLDDTLCDTVASRYEASALIRHRIAANDGATEFGDYRTVMHRGDGWTAVDPADVRVRRDGADETLVVLWSSGHTTTGTIGELCARLALQLDHERDDRDRIERAYWRWVPTRDWRPSDGAELLLVSVRTEVEADGETTVVVRCEEPDPPTRDAIAVGAYLDPEARYEAPF